MVLVSKTAVKSYVDYKCVFSIKEGNSERKPLIFKARLVAKYFTQKKGVDYDEIFSHVLKYTKIRVMISLIAHYNLEPEQMDFTI